jgi:stalled ribosome rescue protein Dom34
MANNYNGIFNSNYSSSNPFGMGNLSNNLEASLADAYGKLEAIKAQQAQLQNHQQKTVFSEIAEEMKEISQDESQFILSSSEYQNAFNKYQTEFSEFLTSKFSNEFLQTTGGRSVEELLFTIRKQKDTYKSKFAKDINDIRDQNKQLLNNNNKLAEDNILLQQQLKEIQEKFLKGINL